MESILENSFSGPIRVFQTRRLPEEATLAGYAALIFAYRLEVPLPRRLAAIGARHRLYEKDGWQIFTPRHRPPSRLEAHLTFALKYEGLDLLVLKRLFQKVGPAPIESMVRAKPTSAYARRIWFLYEWLLGRQLDLPKADKGTYVPVVDRERQYAGVDVTSTRHRVRNNLPGTSTFCPLVFVTEALDAFQKLDLATKARRVAAEVPADMLARAAAFLLVKDSKSSFAIEGERPSPDRIQRWGQAIGAAGRRPIDIDELIRLQRVVIGDARFVKLGLRTEDGFVGEHDRETRAPLPEHIGARHEDLADLIEGLIAFDNTAARTLDPVIAAASLAFGFVYIHPFVDGNGRLHRYMLHHVLTERGFNPPGIVFPISATILDRIGDYRDTLQSYSSRVLPLIQWKQTASHNVHVLNDTVDFYRYFDATPHAQFLYECVERTVTVDLPAETSFLKSYDDFRRDIFEIVDMPERTVSLLFQFLHQNNGILSKRAKEHEFSALTPEEMQRIESAYANHFPPNHARQ
jgi:hypothetical protein